MRRASLVLSLALGATWLQAWSLLDLSRRPKLALRKLGAAALPGLFRAERLDALRAHFGDVDERRFKFGDLRTQRSAVHLPFQEPFSSFPLLGEGAELLPLLSGYLGPDFVLESALVITVDGQTPAQNAHTDTEDEGSVSVHIPLQPLTATFAPLSFCLGTHTDVELLDRAAEQVRRWRCKNESPTEARQRIAAGNSVRREAITILWNDEMPLLESVDLKIGRRSARVAKVRHGSLEVGDEITGVNEMSFATWHRVQRQIPELQEAISLQILRAPDARDLPPAPDLLVGAPLGVGDAVIYDSRTIHWGMANQEFEPRQVLYLNFMSSSFQGYSPDGDAIADASPECLLARSSFREKLSTLKTLQRAG
ncbi:unnamed protein product [Effrenium voratum]|nr:unnamed protein product [Effrenium voratum]